MLATAWKPEYTAKALQIWDAYQQQHDLSKLNGKVAAIEPHSERIWIGNSGVDVAAQMQSEGIETPVYLIRIGSNYYIRKGRR